MTGADLLYAQLTDEPSFDDVLARLRTFRDSYPEEARIVEALLLREVLAMIAEQDGSSAKLARLALRLIEESAA